MAEADGDDEGGRGGVRGGGDDGDRPYTMAGTHSALSPSLS